MLPFSQCNFIFLEKINKSDNTLAGPMKEKKKERNKTQITKIGSERGGITTGYLDTKKQCSPGWCGSVD